MGVALFLAGCGNEVTAERREEAQPRAVAEGARGFQSGSSPAGSTSDAGALAEVAGLLAGIESGGDPLWEEHAARMEELWGEAERRHLEAVRAWGASTLAPLVPEPGLALFYPFGGPDFLGSFLLFPEASTHVLVGLQPPGRLPRLDGVPPDRLASELRRLRKGFTSLVEAGYFQQTDMDADFDQGRLDGLLPVLYIFLARTGNRPLSVRHAGLDREGRLTELGTGEDATVVLIEFVRKGEEEVRELLYFAQDLSDEGFSQNGGAFLRYVEGLGTFNTFMKCAVYLLHLEGFTVLRDVLLERSRTLLQDDSGLLHRDLVSGDFALRYFGVYSRTLPVYRDYFQEDLKKAYETAVEARPLGFAIGYHSQIGEGSLVLATRTAP